MKTSQKCIFIIAGETSGDHHGAKLVNAMQKRDNSLFFCGIGGDALKNAGVRIIIEASTLSVVGITEVFAKLPDILKSMDAVKSVLRTLRPDLLILIDFPDFNLRVAAAAKRLNIPVLYYISPQIWAWRSGRVKKIAKLVDHMAVIFPFEEKFYRKHKVPVSFVGHPLLDTTFSYHSQEDLRGFENPAGLPHKTQTIGLLPGSRHGEIARHLPIMIETAQILSRQNKDLRFILSLAPSIEKQYVEDMISHFSFLTSLFSISTGTDDVFKKSDLVIAASGTVTLETAIAGIPMIVIYKVSPISYWIGRALIRVKHISLVNLVAGKRLVPELIQDKACPKNIAHAASVMLNDASGLEKLRYELSGIKNILGGAGASERVADIAVNMI